MSADLSQVIVHGFLIYYLLSIFLLENGGLGFRVPFVSKTVYHAIPDTNDVFHWQATIIDCLRRVFFVYESRLTSEIGSDSLNKVWYVKNNQKAQLWACPLCLGLWLAVVLEILNTIFLTPLNIISDDILKFIFLSIITTVASAGAGVFLYNFVDEEDEDVSS